MKKPRKVNRKIKDAVVKVPLTKENAAQVVPETIEAALPEKHETLDEALEAEAPELVED